MGEFSAGVQVPLSCLGQRGGGEQQRGPARGPLSPAKPPRVLGCANLLPDKTVGLIRTWCLRYWGAVCSRVWPIFKNSLVASGGLLTAQTCALIRCQRTALFSQTGKPQRTGNQGNVHVRAEWPQIFQSVKTLH